MTIIGKRSGLAKLPDEVYDDIVRELDRTTLASLCQVSRTIYQRSISKLYSTLSFEVGDCKELKGRTHPLVFAVFAVVHNSTLARFVDHISITTDWSHFERLPLPEDTDETWRTAWGSSASSREHLSEGTSPALRDLFGASRIPQEVSERCLDLLGCGRVEALIFCMIMACTNIQSLTIGSLHLPLLDDILPSLFVVSAHNQLSSVTLSPDVVSEDDVWLHDCPYICLGTILQLPSIAYVSAPLPELDLRDRGFARSALVQLSLKRAQLSEEGLGFILRSTPRLKRLTYWSCYKWDSAGRPSRQHIEYLDCDRLGDSLSYVRETLEELSLSFYYFSHNPDIKGVDLRGSCGYLSVLSEFLQLKSVMVPHSVLLGWKKSESTPRHLTNLLPTGLRELTLTDDLCDMGWSEWSEVDLLGEMESLASRDPIGTHSQYDLDLRMHIRYTSFNWSGGKGMKTLSESMGTACRVFEPEVSASDAQMMPDIMEKRPQDWGSRNRATVREEREYAEWRRNNPSSPRGGRGRGRRRGQ